MPEVIVYDSCEENTDVIGVWQIQLSFICSAIAPAEVDQVIFDENEQQDADLIVPD